MAPETAPNSGQDRITTSAAQPLPAGCERWTFKSFDKQPWRPGRKVGRTIYAQSGSEASDDDVLIGVMDTEWYAEITCRDHNIALGLEGVQGVFPNV